MGVEAPDSCCPWEYLLTTARMSRALRSRSSLPSYLTSVPPYLLKMTTSPSATSSGIRVAVVVDPTWAGSEDVALLRLLLGGVGNDQAGGRGLLCFERLNEDAVLERLDRCHVKPLSRVSIL